MWDYWEGILNIFLGPWQTLRNEIARENQFSWWSWVKVNIKSKETEQKLHFGQKQIIIHKQNKGKIKTF